jgi:tetratricopeptide (TPR) repeat protein
MGLRFYRRLRLFPGVTVNLSKTGASMSFGVRGAHYTVGPRGRRVTVGLPGTGLFYTQTDRTRRAAAPRQRGNLPTSPDETPAPAPFSPAVAAPDRFRPGFFKRLITPPEEQELVDGLRAIAEGNEAIAYKHLSRATQLADGAMLAAVLALKNGLLPEAEQDVRSALDHAERLGAGLARYGVSSTLSVQITDDLTAHLPHTREGALLLLVEVLQHSARPDEALRTLDEIRRTWPQDPVVIASMCELLLDRGSESDRQQVVALTDGLQNLTPVQSVLLLFRTRALRELHMPEGAIQTATAGLSRPAERSDELLHELRYERALAYADAGNARRSRAELERIFAEDSTFADVRERLGITEPPV